VYAIGADEAALTRAAPKFATSAAVDVGLVPVPYGVVASWRQTRRGRGVAHAARTIGTPSASGAIVAGQGAGAPAVDVGLVAIVYAIATGGRLANPARANLVGTVGGRRAAFASAARARARAPAVDARLVPVSDEVRAGGNLARLGEADAALAVGADVAGREVRAR
jgi:hypothetical protein